MTTDYRCIDSETCGFFGPIVLFQWGDGDDGPISLWSTFRERIKDTLELYKETCSKRILGFNLAFDWFKIQQQWTTLRVLGERVGMGERPLDHIDEYAMCEPIARDGPCLKPLGAMDLMLHARKGPWQNLMARDPITIRRVPVPIAALVKNELQNRIRIPDIFFAKRGTRKPDALNPDGSSKWWIKRIKNAEGENPDFVNIELDFAPSSKLKALATHELGLDPNETLVFEDVEVDKKFRPNENGFAPFALSVGKPGHWDWAWPDVIRHHNTHWSFNDLAREYATKDIVYPRLLYQKWGRPAFDDDDSLLACLAGSTRWKGFAVDLEGIKKLRDEAYVKMRLAPRAPATVMAWLKEVMNPIEALMLIDPKTGGNTTKKVVLEEVRKFKACRGCDANEPKHDCKTMSYPHPAAERANLVLEARKGKKELEIYDKLMLAGRFHVSVNVIGTRSSRQSGGQVSEGKSFRKSSGLNPQGIQKKKVVRQQFPLAFTQGDAKSVAFWESVGFGVLEEKLVGGDFDKFEVCIADAYYHDPQLHEDLTAIEPPCDHGECKFANKVCAACSHDFHGKKACEEKGCKGCTETGYAYKPKCSKCTGKPSKPGSIKIHAIVGTLVYPPRTYWEIRATDGKDRDELQVLFPEWKQEHWADLYTRAKSAFFALIYFGNEDTLASRLAIPKEDGKVAYTKIMLRYPVMASKRNEFFERFCPIRQPDGGRVFWEEPDDFCTSMLGFQRFFTMENQVIRTLYVLAEDVPESWHAIKIKVKRREKFQTVAGATRSALYGAGFGLQGANMRASGNHVIQSTGATLTKMLQARIWKFQPTGINPWVVRPLNVHDELPTALDPRIEADVARVQSEFLIEQRSLVPMLNMRWKAMGTWAGK